MSALHWWPAYIGIGSNLESPEEQLNRATQALGELPDTLVIGASGRYKSAPMGPVEQPDFINGVVGLLTRLSAHELLKQMQLIERHQGKKSRDERWGPRTIDLDLLAYGDQIIDDGELVVPHPGIAERNFVLLPWQEIAPTFCVPGLGKVAALAADVSRSEPRIERIG